MKWIDAKREKLTGLTWPHLTFLALLSGVIGGAVAFWWELDEDWFPVLALVTGTTVVLVNVAFVKLSGRIYGRYDE